ncbi:MAG: response regulator transcription factor [Pseudomonadota bacterium]
MTENILIIEDDQDINQLIAINLRDMGLNIERFHDGEQGFNRAQKKFFELIILDIMLPHMTGLEICSQLRARKIYTPILMLTAKNTETDRVIGLEIGADDYLTKPFSVRELQARVTAILRRNKFLRNPSHQTNDALSFGELTIYEKKREVILKGEKIELTSTEFDLLNFLAKFPGQVFSRSQLLDNVWGYQHSGYDHTINSHINRLRTKLEVDPSNPQYVLTVWGVGYKFSEDFSS